MRNVLSHCVYSLWFLWRAENLAMSHSDDIIPTLKIQKKHRNAVSHVHNSASWTAAPISCLRLPLGERKGTDYRHIPSACLFHAEGSSVFQREPGDFSPFPRYSQPARPSTALGRIGDKSSMDCKYTKPVAFLPLSLSATIGQTVRTVQLSGI